jgi:hypothetical protein
VEARIAHGRVLIRHDIVIGKNQYRPRREGQRKAPKARTRNDPFDKTFCGRPQVTPRHFSIVTADLIACRNPAKAAELFK